MRRRPLPAWPEGVVYEPECLTRTQEALLDYLQDTRTLSECDAQTSAVQGLSQAQLARYIRARLGAHQYDDSGEPPRGVLNVQGRQWRKP